MKISRIKGFLVLPFALSLMCMFSCNNTGKNEQVQSAEKPRTELSTEVLTKAKQDALTPDRVIDILKEGNKRYVASQSIRQDYIAQREQTSAGQYPQAIILSCIDSRVPVEHIFDFTVGDAFVGRVAGNIVDSDMVGSMEYACAVAGVKLLLVMGHTECGAVVSAIKKAEVSPNVTGLLNKIRPSVESLKYDGECSYKNHDYVNEVIKANVMRSIDDVRKLSPILTNLEKEGKIKIVGAIYDIKSGEVTFL